MQNNVRNIMATSLVKALLHTGFNYRIGRLIMKLARIISVLMVFCIFLGLTACKEDTASNTYTAVPYPYVDETAGNTGGNNTKKGTGKIGY